jgi:cytochrome c
MSREHRGSIRMRNAVLGPMLLAAVLVLSIGPAHAAGDPAKGQQVFQSQCAACHSVSPGVTLFGPSLAAVYGKPAAGVAGYAYSPALTKAHLVWTAAALDKFLTAPQTDVPGTKMPFAGLSDPQQRQDVIAYLAQLAQGGAPKS